MSAEAADSRNRKHLISIEVEKSREELAEIGLFKAPGIGVQLGRERGQLGIGKEQPGALAPADS